MRFGVITWMALLYGAIWGGLWMTLTGLLLMLVSGLIAVPTIGMAALVGVCLLYTSPSPRDRG